MARRPLFSMIRFSRDVFSISLDEVNYWCAVCTTRCDYGSGGGCFTCKQRVHVKVLCRGQEVCTHCKEERLSGP